MKVANELPNYDTWQNLGNRALYLVATLPEKKNKQKNTPIKDVSQTNLKQFVTHSLTTANNGSPYEKQFLN